MRSRIQRTAALLTLCLAGALGSSSAASPAAPTVTGISPNNGPDAGGTSVTITGTGFITGSTVKCGDASATGVTIVSSEVCIAAGYSLNSSGKDVTLAERWNGTAWKLQTTPNNENGEGLLSGGVSCSSSTSCAAVGSTGKTFAEVYG